VRLAVALAPLVGTLCLVSPARSADPAPPAPDEAAELEEEAELEEAEFSDLRERLTEREDENRVEDPWSTELWGHPLTLAGEIETFFGYIAPLSLGEPDENYDRLLWEEGLETEVFYSLGTPLSFFVQLLLAIERDLLSQTPDRVTDFFAERGEMWIYSEDIAGSGIHFEVGRLDFEDDRLWWWDDDLDAVRLAYETETFEAVFAVAHELFPNRSDRDFIEPEQDDVLRLMGEVSWDWRPHHVLEVFALHQDDHSTRHRLGRSLRPAREDESDAELTWLGVRAMGAWALRSRGIFGYWLDTAVVWGDERFIEFDEVASNESVVADVTHRDVRGWAVDAGVNWILPLPLEPRLFAGYAFGSGDRHPESGDDRSFRQTGIHANESGFGGVQRFGQYGNLLDPELSNLSVVTAGVGLTLLESSSIDLVYHYYRLVEPAPALRDARIDPELTGTRRDLGHGVDVVLAVEEWERLELELSGSVFRSGRAFAADRGEWAYGGFFAFRIAF
jgi:hypothetical protein